MISILEDYKEFFTDSEQDFLEEQMPFAGAFQQIGNFGRLIGREVERTAANVGGHAKKVAGAAVDVFNPFLSVDGMKQNAKAMDDQIKQSLEQVDEKYRDVIEWLWATAQLTDFQAFLFFLNPAVYLGTKTMPKALGASIGLLGNVAGFQANHPLMAYSRRFTNAINTVTTARGPGANQPAGMSGGGYGGSYGGDFGGDYGGDY